MVSQLLNVKNLTVSFGHRPLFHEINLSVDTGERIALVGRNGAGKSTLLKIIAGMTEADGGSVERTKGLVVSLLSQAVPVELEGTVYEVVAQGLSDEKQVDADDTWSFRQRIETTLSKLSLNGAQKIDELSGGLKRRVLLARALVNDPDILLLDEPTNHLDIDAIIWLESFLKKYPKTIIFITHDRDFMSNLATRIIEIDYQQLFSWPGDYAHYCRLKEDLVAAQAREQALFEKRLSTEETWIRQGIKARRTRNEGRVRRLEAMRREKSEQVKQQGKAKISIQSGNLSGKLVFDIEDVSFAYNDKTIIRDFSAIVGRGDRVGIVGANGSGKSTLIKLLLGELVPTSGKIARGTNLEVAYFDQYRFELDDTQSVLDNVAQGREKITIDGKDKHVISYLQDFLFSPERARMNVSVLSGGEKNRLLLAKLFTKPSNLIVMDEPTNDLDIETLELLEEKLSDYPGTLLIVSHDRTFLNNVATQLWVCESGGKVREFVGGYTQWLSHQSQESTPVTKPVEKPSQEKQEKKWSIQEKKELAALPGKITKLEEKIQLLQDKMLQPDFYQQASEAIKAHNQQVAQLEAELETCYVRWQELEDMKS